MGRTGRLTKKRVDAARYTGGDGRPSILWDTELAGFGLRIYPSGAKAYVLRYRTAGGRAGRQRWLTLGPANVLTLDEARRKARKLLAGILDGSDPAESRQQEREAIRFADLASDYLRERASQKRSGATDEQRLRDFLLPAWGKRKAQSVTRADVARRESAMLPLRSQVRRTP